MQELQLYKKMKAGDESAFDQLFHLYYEQLVRFAFAKCYDQSMSEDIVQNVFIEFWTKRNQWNIQTSVIAYLKRTVNSRCIDYFRKEKTIADHKENYTKESLSLNSTSPEEELLTKENLQVIYEKIELLPPKCKAVFKLSRFEEMTYAQIAENLGVSKKTVEFHMGNALRLLREMVFVAFVMINF